MGAERDRRTMQVADIMSREVRTVGVVATLSADVKLAVNISSG